MPTMRELREKAKQIDPAAFEFEKRSKLPQTPEETDRLLNALMKAHETPDEPKE